MTRKRRILEQLGRDDLIAAVDRFELSVADRRVRNQLIDALAGSRKATLADILDPLSRDPGPQPPHWQQQRHCKYVQRRGPTMVGPRHAEQAARCIVRRANTGKFKSRLNENGFSMNLRRVGRIAPPLAADILREFARHQSRTAFEQSLVTDNLQKSLSQTPRDEEPVAPNDRNRPNGKLAMD